LLAFVAVIPASAFACERCFGAGADSPTVAAIGVSMMTLLILVSFVFTGIARFFNQSYQRSLDMTSGENPLANERPIQRDRQTRTSIKPDEQ